MSMHVVIDGHATMANASCVKCCCAPVPMQPGEVQLMTLSYVQWTLPLGGRGLIPTTQILIEPNDAACNHGSIDGWGPPFIVQQSAATPVDTPKSGNLATAMQPSGNQFVYSSMPLYGPQHGSVVIGGNGVWTYTPQNSFVGYDYIWYKVEDVQGRTIVRYIDVTVGNPAAIGIPHKAPVYGLSIDRSAIVINNAYHMVTFPMEMSPSALGSVDECIRYRVTVRQPASDCNYTFYNVSCFDVYAVKC